MTQFPLVAVTWRDAHGTATTSYNLHEIPHAPVEITTYGLLLREDATGVSVAGESCKDGTYRGVTYIPRELVISIRPIRKPRKPRAAKTAAVEIS